MSVGSFDSELSSGRRSENGRLGPSDVHSMDNSGTSPKMTNNQVLTGAGSFGLLDDGAIRAAGGEAGVEVADGALGREEGALCASGAPLPLKFAPFFAIAAFLTRKKEEKFLRYSLYSVGLLILMGKASRRNLGCSRGSGLGGPMISIVSSNLCGDISRKLFKSQNV